VKVGEKSGCQRLDWVETKRMKGHGNECVFRRLVKGEGGGGGGGRRAKRTNPELVHGGRGPRLVKDFREGRFGPTEEGDADGGVAVVDDLDEEVDADL
jgi:hypothetical protein